jgi:hypothetical protein
VARYGRLTLAVSVVGHGQCDALPAARSLPQAAQVPVGAAVGATDGALVAALAAVGGAHALGSTSTHYALLAVSTLDAGAGLCNTTSGL